MPFSVDSFFLKLFKFGIVGLSGTALDFGVTYLAKEKLRWNKYIANSCGFVVAVTDNYYLNRIYTFHSTDPDVGWQFGKFMGVALVGLALNNLIIFVMTEKLRLNFYFSKLSATFIVFLWNFTLNYFFTFVGR
ncbi:GtrA family protein [Pontibacter harenae]|uniref:GtrA family protein n=1 Tax=Pontibacter harenae TaxID=2894083 RepID=UPI001E609599|nr:GtrA family protein [Pontibacter harenae]MCC9166716.1 GtrA family protein [Pontibacter harenae]